MQQKERNSERTLVWLVVAIIGAKVLGLDIGQLLGQVKDVSDQIKASGLSDEMVLGIITAVYNWGRIKKKEAEIMVSGVLEKDYSK